MPILSVENISKSFGALRAVGGVSFQVPQGQVYGIAGPNGSGKSTTFNIITGIPFRADSGLIMFDGRAIQRLAPHQIARLGLTRTFQKDAEFESLSAYENVRLAAVNSGRVQRPGVDAAVEAALQGVHFDGRRVHRPVRELSVFDRKQLMIASALAMQPKLLMMDEPASGLTKPEVEDLASLIRGVNQQGVTVVLIEHVLPLLLAVSQHLLVLNHGQVLAEGAPHEVVAHPEVIEAYLGRRGQK